jgi:hypothetical protein
MDVPEIIERSQMEVGVTPGTLANIAKVQTLLQELIYVEAVHHTPSAALSATVIMSKMSKMSKMFRTPGCRAQGGRQ